MRQTLSRGVVAAAAATGILSLYASAAFADSNAEGVAKGSAGVAAGNTVQVPVKLPVNLCGNNVGVVAALNETLGNSCKNTEHKSDHKSSDSYGSGARAEGVAKGSPGVASGNTVQVPVELELNVCGNTVDGAAVANETVRNACENSSYGEEEKSSKPSCGESGYGSGSGDCKTSTPPTGRATPPTTRGGEVPRPTPPSDRSKPSSPETEREQPGEPPHLAETGSEDVLAASAASAALIVGGVMLYRRGRADSCR